MVSHLKELSEDEKIRQQCEARADYESRLTSQYNRGRNDGIDEGRKETLVALVRDGALDVSVAARTAGMSEDEFKKMMLC